MAEEQEIRDGLERISRQRKGFVDRMKLALGEAHGHRLEAMGRLALAVWRQDMLQGQDQRRLLQRSFNIDGRRKREVLMYKEFLNDTALRQMILHAWFTLAIREHDLNVHMAREEDMHVKIHRLIDNAIYKWGDTDGALLLRHVLAAWGGHAMTEREMRCREVFMRREDAVGACRIEAVKALGRTRVHSYQQDVLAAWHLLAKVETAAHDGATLSEEQYHQLSVMLLATQHRAQEAVTHHSVKSSLVEDLHGYGKLHKDKIELMEKEVEMLTSHLPQAQQRLLRSSHLADSAETIKEHCSLQALQLQELEREVEMLQSHVTGARRGGSHQGSPGPSSRNR
jgi:hypothetical protein